ncbi:hypothetical protein QJQ45_021134 [Haematococcus lacustris]|nr:hypothetical protein QJQ45_021134 [Haematococcus lacustris]
MAMEFLFGKRKTPADLLRENKRMLDKAIRELDRERMGLQNQDKKIVADIKKMAKEGQMAAVKVMAKSLIRNRHAVTKMHGLKSQLQAVSLRLATLKSTQAMADAMRGATKAMRMMNKQMNLPQLQNIMREFEKQNEKMEMTSEMMGDAVDDAMEGEDEEEETDELVNQVLDEIGIGNLTEASLLHPSPLNTIHNNIASLHGFIKSPCAPLFVHQALRCVEENPKLPLASAPKARVEVQQPAQPAAMAEMQGGAGGSASAGAGDAGGIDDDLQARLDKLRKS